MLSAANEFYRCLPRLRRRRSRGYEFQSGVSQGSAFPPSERKEHDDYTRRSRRAEVSTATVSHVVNNTRRVGGDTRRRVERAIDELGFRPNEAGRRLALRRKSLVEESRESPNVAGSSLKQAEPPGLKQAEPPGPDWVKSPAAATWGDTAVALLRLVRVAQPVSRADIARRLGVHRSTVTEIVKPLLGQGLLRETDLADADCSSASRIGRPATGIEFTDDRYFIGLNLGVRQSRAGAVTIGGQLLAESTFDTPRDAGEALRLMRAAVADLRFRVKGRSLFSVGVSVPGPTCAARRRLLYAPHLGWRDLDVAGAMTSEPGLGPPLSARGDEGDVPVVVENDARAAALYEARTHTFEEDGRAWRDFILVRAGTGVGVGIVRGGEVYAGAGAAGGSAGESGHMTIVADGRRCVCGGRGCWESYASVGSAVSLYMGERAAWKGRAPKFVEIVARAEAGEGRARATLERLGGYLGVGVANLIGGLGIPRVVVSGRLAHGWKFMSGPLREAVGRSMAGRVTEWDVVPGRRSGSGLGGALEVAVDYYLSNGSGLSTVRSVTGRV